MPVITNIETPDISSRLLEGPRVRAHPYEAIRTDKMLSRADSDRLQTGIRGAFSIRLTCILRNMAPHIQTGLVHGETLHRQSGVPCRSWLIHGIPKSRMQAAVHAKWDWRPLSTQLTNRSWRMPQSMTLGIQSDLRVVSFLTSMDLRKQKCMVRIAVRSPSLKRNVVLLQCDLKRSFY